jgi:hypothetical protein
VSFTLLMLYFQGGSVQCPLWSRLGWLQNQCGRHGAGVEPVPRGSVVVKALFYKPEGRGFDSRWGEFLNLPNPSGRTRP